MTSWTALLILALGVGFVLGSQMSHRAEIEDVAQAPAPANEDKITEGDVELYIAVYSAMQSDHGLTIEGALAGKELSLDQFRDLERRVQSDQHTVDRVRTALLTHAKARNSNTWLPPGATAPPAAN